MSEGTIGEVTESRVNTRISGKQSDENGLKAACAEDSYRRLGQMKAPGYLSWSHENRSQLVRIPAAIEEYRRAELRSPDQLANPYLPLRY